MIARLIALVLILLAGSTESAEITKGEFSGRPVIVVEGPLVEQDVERFRSAIAGVNSGIVLLHSNGGSLRAGIEIGRTIRMRGLATWVSSAQGPCMSACGFAWLAGSPRMLDGRAQVGFHAAYVIEDGKPLMTGSANALVGAYLRDLGLSDDTIIYATDARPEGMRFLTRQDAQRIGLSLEYLDYADSTPVDEWSWALPMGPLPVPEWAPRPKWLPYALIKEPAASLAILYEEQLGGPPLATKGQVKWAATSSEVGHVIEARVSFVSKLTVDIRIVPGKNMNLPASQVWEFRFSEVDDLNGAVQTVQRIAFKQTEQDRGSILTAVPAKITSHYHLIALTDESRASASNIELMLGRDWIDIPFVSADNKRALLTFQKGVIGDGVFRKVFAEWQKAGDAISREWRFSSGYVFAGANLSPAGTYAALVSTCQERCEARSECVAFSFDLSTNRCFLKKEVDKAVWNHNYSSAYYSDTPVAFQR